MAEQKTQGAFYPPAYDLSGQVVNDFIAIQGQRVAKDTALAEAQKTLDLQQIKTSGEVQKEQYRQYGKLIKAQQDAQKAQRKAETEMLGDLPRDVAGMYNSQAQVILGFTDLFSNNLDKMIEEKGNDFAAQRAALYDSYADQLTKTHGSSFSKGLTLAQKGEAKSLTDTPGVVETFDLDALSEVTQMLNQPDRFSFTQDANYNDFVIDKQTGAQLPLEQWVRSQIEQTQSAFISRPKLNYKRTIDEAFADSVTSSKGKRVPAYAENSVALESWFDLHFGMEDLDEERMRDLQNDPFFMTAISQRAIDQGITTSEVLADPAEMREATESFKQVWSQKLKDLKSAEPPKKTSKAKSGKEVLVDSGFGVVNSDYEKLQEVYSLYDQVGPIDPESLAITGVVQANMAPVFFDEDFSTSIGAKGRDLKITEAALDSDGGMYVSLYGNYAHDLYEGISAASDISAIEYKSGTKSMILSIGDPGYNVIVQALGDKILSKTESGKVKDFYAGLNSVDQANFYAGLMALAKQTNPTFEQTVRDSFNTNVSGVTYDELKAAIENGSL